MRINGFGAGPIEERERAKTEPTTPAPASKPADASVVISSGAREISAAVSRSQAARSERVAAVKAKVDSGAYRIDRDTLAERLADDELARAGRAPDRG